MSINIRPVEEMRHDPLQEAFARLRQASLDALRCSIEAEDEERCRLAQAIELLTRQP